MNENDALSALHQCCALMNKLAEQGYDYLYDPADLALVKQYQKAIEAITYFSEPAQGELERTFPGKGFIWLTFYHETVQDVETLAAQPSDPYNLHDDALWQHLEQHGSDTPPPEPSSPTNQETPAFRPFKQRLEAHQRDMQEGLATDILRRRDDAFLLYMSEAAEQLPLLLPIAEKLLARVYAEIERTPGQAPFTKKEQDRIMGVREMIQEYDGKVPEILW